MYLGQGILVLSVSIDSTQVGGFSLSPLFYISLFLKSILFQVATVHCQVATELIGASEALWAVGPGAGVRLLSRVGPHVRLEVVGAGELAMAHIALEGTDSSVLAAVSPELVGSREPLPAAVVLTHVGLLTGVLPYVHLEVRELQVALGAAGVQANERFPLLLGFRWCLPLLPSLRDDRVVPRVDWHRTKHVSMHLHLQSRHVTRAGRTGRGRRRGSLEALWDVRESENGVGCRRRRWYHGVHLGRLGPGGVVLKRHGAGWGRGDGIQSGFWRLDGSREVEAELCVLLRQGGVDRHRRVVWAEVTVGDWRAWVHGCVRRRGEPVLVFERHELRADFLVAGVWRNCKRRREREREKREKSSALHFLCGWSTRSCVFFAIHCNAGVRAALK